MRRVAIKSKSIPNKPRSDNYPAGTSVAVGSGGGSTVVTPGGSDIEVIKTTDSKSATDKNVFSALRSAAEFISKKVDDKVSGVIDFLKGLKIKGKEVEDVARKDEDDVELNDKTVPSSARVLKEIKQRALSRLFDDTAEGNITFEKEITVEQLATIARCVVDMISSPAFVDGFTGEGFQIWKSIATGDWNMTIDNLTIRKMFTVFELLVQKIRSVGGMIVVSATDGKIERVERIGDNYEITFASGNGFQANDLIRHQVFTGEKVDYYWTEVQSVDGSKVVIPVSEFEGIVPQIGDECVLMGNTKNKLRQGLITIAATEDGQPRIDVLTGVNKKSFEGNLAVRMGNLDGIKDTYFPADNQPHGDGLYGVNCFLRGTFLLTTGEDVLTKFTVMENLFRSEMESLRNEIQEKDNYLSNSAFASNTDKWVTTNDVRFFTVGDKLLYFNSNFYSDKKKVADIIDTGSRKVLRIKASGIKQVNADLSDKPDKESSFFVSFRIKVLDKGTVTVGFPGQGLYHTEMLEPTDEFTQKEYSGTWNGTGDFELKFTGDAYIHSLAVTNDAFNDMYTHFESKIEQTDKNIALLVKATSVEGGAIGSRIDVISEGIRLVTEKTDSIGNTLTAMGIVIDGQNESITSFVKKDGIVNSINLDPSGIKINANRVELSAYTPKDGVIAAINLSSGGVKIDASKIELNGKVSINDLDSTVIIGGYLNTSQIKVKELIADDAYYGSVLKVNHEGISSRDDRGSDLSREFFNLRVGSGEYGANGGELKMFRWVRGIPVAYSILNGDGLYLYNMSGSLLKKFDYQS